MLFLCYPKCSTCQKAKAWLEERGISYDLRDIKQNNPTVEELTAWYRKSGLPLKKFFNTSGLQYKALGLKDKLTAMSEDEQLALLATDGMLVKRPLLVGEDFVLTGFRAGRMGSESWDDPDDRLRPPGRHHQNRVPSGVEPVFWRRGPLFHSLFLPYPPSY